MRNSLACQLAFGAVLLAIGPAAQAQSLDCLAAYDVIEVIRQQEYDPSADVNLLHDKVVRSTEDCPELRELWELRAKLALKAGNLTDVEVAKKRGNIPHPLVKNPPENAGFDPTKPIHKRFALVAGTSDFNPRLQSEVQKLEYADNDLRLMQDVFKTTLGFDEVKGLTGSNFTATGLRAEISKLRETQADDLVVIYLLSHGVPTKEDSRNVSFILAYDSDLADFHTRYSTTISATRLVQEIFQEIPAQRIILILDTCYSGNAISGQRDSAGHPAPYLLDAYTKGAGRVVIAAAGAGQRSWEVPEKRQGAFVYCLNQAADKTKTDAAGDGRQRSVGELFTATKACVMELKPEQKPELFASDGARSVALSR
jgi:hypothetical protein